MFDLNLYICFNSVNPVNFLSHFGVLESQLITFSLFLNKLSNLSEHKFPCFTNGSNIICFAGSCEY